MVMGSKSTFRPGDGLPQHLSRDDDRRRWVLPGAALGEVPKMPLLEEAELPGAVADRERGASDAGYAPGVAESTEHVVWFARLGALHSRSLIFLAACFASVWFAWLRALRSQGQALRRSMMVTVASIAQAAAGLSWEVDRSLVCVRGGGGGGIGMRLTTKLRPCPFDGVRLDGGTTLHHCCVMMLV